MVHRGAGGGVASHGAHIVAAAVPAGDLLHDLFGRLEREVHIAVADMPDRLGPDGRENVEHGLEPRDCSELDVNG